MRPIKTDGHADRMRGWTVVSAVAIRAIAANTGMAVQRPGQDEPALTLQNATAMPANPVSASAIATEGPPRQTCCTCRGQRAIRREAPMPWSLANRAPNRTGAAVSEGRQQKSRGQAPPRLPCGASANAKSAIAQAAIRCSTVSQFQATEKEKRKSFCTGIEVSYSLLVQHNILNKSGRASDAGSERLPSRRLETRAMRRERSPRHENKARKYSYDSAAIEVRDA